MLAIKTENGKREFNDNKNSAMSYRLSYADTGKSHSGAIKKTRSKQIVIILKIKVVIIFFWPLIQAAKRCISTAIIVSLS